MREPARINLVKINPYENKNFKFETVTIKSTI